MTKEKSFITLAPGADHPLVAVESDGEVEALLHRLDAGSVEHFLQEPTVHRYHHCFAMFTAFDKIPQMMSFYGRRQIITGFYSRK